ncbi:MAG: L-rhamnose mutarotase [Spirochaetia bacterium]|nr:L-rhamnose mutarotase [Spirochaetia bacterium]
MKRYGEVIELKKEKLDEYVRLHREVWPKVLERLTHSHIHNYSIYLKKFPDGKYYLFSYFEYTGNDFDADTGAMAEDSVTQEWWAVCKPCHSPFPDRNEKEWWSNMEEVFHAD